MFCSASVTRQRRQEMKRTFSKSSAWARGSGDVRAKSSTTMRSLLEPWGLEKAAVGSARAISL